MKINMGKQLFCCLLAAFFVLCCFPLQSMAAEQTGTIVFSTFEEFRSYCDEAAGFSGGSLSCEEADLQISEDMVIPPGRTVVFRYFTVPEGITLTIMEGAELMTYGLTVQGELINYGTVFQGDLSGEGEVQDAEIAAHIPGHVINKGDMTLTDVFGKRNIQWVGSHFTMIETDSFDEKLKAEVKKDEPQPTASPTPEVTPTPEITPQPVFSDELRRHLLEVFDVLEVILPRLAFFLVLAVFGFVIKSALAEKMKQKKASGNASSSSEIQRRATSGKSDLFRQGYTGSPRDARTEDHFQRDRKKRMSQLDDWLRSGIIDRKEYNELKKRYKQEDSQ